MGFKRPLVRIQSLGPPEIPVTAVVTGIFPVCWKMFSLNFPLWRFFTCFPLSSSNAPDKVLHPLCAFPLHLIGDMTVDIQCKGGGGMAQVALHRFDVVPAFYRCHGIRVPLWHNKDKSENPCSATGWLVCPYSFSTNFPAKSRHNEGCQKVRCTIKDKENAYYPTGASAPRPGAFYQQGTGR